MTRTIYLEREQTKACSHNPLLDTGSSETYTPEWPDEPGEHPEKPDSNPLTGCLALGKLCHLHSNPSPTPPSLSFPSPVFLGVRQAWAPVPTYHSLTLISRSIMESLCTMGFPILTRQRSTHTHGDESSERDPGRSVCRENAALAGKDLSCWQETH